MLYLPGLHQLAWKHLVVLGFARYRIVLPLLLSCVSGDEHVDSRLAVNTFAEDHSRSLDALQISPKLYQLSPRCACVSEQRERDEGTAGSNWRRVMSGIQ